MDAARRPEREPQDGPERPPDRERAYNGADRQPAQNLDTAYRSRWAVNAARSRRRDQADMPVDILPTTTLPAESPPAERRPGVETGPRGPIDLTPLMRLAQESCWTRFFNRPRHSAIADA